MDYYINHLQTINSIKIINPDKQDLRLPPPDIEQYNTMQNYLHQTN